MSERAFTAIILLCAAVMLSVMCTVVVICSLSDDYRERYTYCVKDARRSHAACKQSGLWP